MRISLCCCNKSLNICSMKNILCIILILQWTCICYAQRKPPPNDTINGRVIYRLADESPKSIVDLRTFLAENLEYPKKARRNDQEGRVLIQFIVSETGNIENAHVVKGVCEELDNEALRVVNLMTRWKPGTKEGKPVCVYFTLPIQFSLD